MELQSLRQEAEELRKKIKVMAGACSLSGRAWGLGWSECVLGSVSCAAWSCGSMCRGKSSRSRRLPVVGRQRL